MHYLIIYQMGEDSLLYRGEKELTSLFLLDHN